MTQKAGVRLPSELIDLVAQRARLWGEYDAAAASRDQLEQLAAQVTAGGEPEALRPLTTTAQPPEELAAAAKALHQEIETFNRLRVDLRDAEQRRFNAIMIGVGIAVVVVVGGLLAVIVGLK